MSSPSSPPPSPLLFLPFLPSSSLILVLLLLLLPLLLLLLYLPSSFPFSSLSSSPLCRFWLGVELERPHGKHDGSRSGVRYFRCKPNHGIFVLPSKVKR